MTNLEKLIVPKELGDWLDTRGVGNKSLLFTLIDELREQATDEFSGKTREFVFDYKKELIEVIIGTRDYEVEEPKVYARVKGWELMLEPDRTYFNKAVYGSDKFCLASKYLTDRTKSEWNELGVNEDNAIFEAVQG